jgi:ribonuclease P protein component
VLVAPKAVIASRSDRTQHARPRSNQTTRNDNKTRGADHEVDRAAVVATTSIRMPSRGDMTLPGPADYDLCLRRPAVLRSGPFALHLSWRTTLTEPPAWRLGLVIPKRYESSAVARNTIKRRWRAAFVRTRSSWADEFGSADLVVRLQSPLVPKVASTAKNKGVAPQPVISLPAKVRARDRFDPQATLVLLAERLRSRGMRSNAAVTLS